MRGAFAFDTVPHWALKPHLARNGVQGSIINVANEMHKETNIAIYETKMKTENNIEVEIDILRRGKQGDPLSQLLFNLYLEPL